MRGRELVLHAGLPESGTPVLQTVLRALRPQLHELGIAIVDHEAIEALDGVGGWHREVVPEPTRLRAFEREFGALVVGEEAEVARLTGQRPRATVVSSDHLLGASYIGRDDASRFRPLAVPAVAQVIRATAASTVRVVLHVRRQDRLMELCYLRAIAEGGHHSFADQFPYRFEPVLDHAELVARLRRIPEVRRVRVRPIELVRPEPAGRARDILDLIGVADRVELGSLPDVAPEADYSHRALGIALDINRYLDTEQERQRVRRFLTEQFPGRDDDSTRFLTDDDRGRILSAHAAANRRLFARHLPNLAEDTYVRDGGSPVWAAASATDLPEPADVPGASVPERGVRTWRRDWSGRLLARRHDRRGRLRSRYRARSADVLLVSAPGCGSGWLRMLLGIVLGRHSGLGTHDPLRFTEAGVTRSGMPRIVALRPGASPPRRRSGMQRVVVLVRDPRDVLAAARSDDAFEDEPMGSGANQARLEDLLQSYDTWAEDRGRYPDDLAIVRYEDLVRDAPALLRAVLSFAGVGTVDPRWLSSAVEESGFELVTRRSCQGVHQRGAGDDGPTATRTASSAGARAFGYAPGRIGSAVAPPTDVGLTLGPGVDEVTFPIDLVYTWVDGNDPDWRAARDEALTAVDLDGHPVDALTLSRHHDHGELRYSLRSVAEFAHFVRRIFIVTAGQVPDWLNVSNERITVIDHREVFTDPDCLPTFNSHAIESRLHHIDGLAEHYLYMNDDFFFGRRVTADRFFHANGTTKFFLSPARIDAGDNGTRRSVNAAALNTRRLVFERFGREVTRKFKHAPYPQRRSVLFEMEEVLREEFERTAASRVRSQDDVAVPSSLFHYYSYFTGRAVPGSIRSRYVGLEARRLRGRLRALRRKRNFDVLCLNDSLDDRDGDREPRAALVHRFMETYWPTKGPFER